MRKKSKRTTKYKKKPVICDVETAQCEDGTVKCTETTKCEKKTVTCDVGTVLFKDGIVKCEKKVREPPNVTKELSYVMLELYNVEMEPSNLRKQCRGITKCEKKMSHVMLDLHNMRIESSNVREKKKRNYQT